MDKWTPGPWHLDRNRQQIMGANGDVVKVQFITLSSGDEPQANAKLIAASPALVEALRELVKAEEDYGDPTNVAVNEAWNKARALLDSLE